MLRLQEVVRNLAATATGAAAGAGAGAGAEAGLNYLSPAEQVPCVEVSHVTVCLLSELAHHLYSA